MSTGTFGGDPQRPDHWPAPAPYSYGPPPSVGQPSPAPARPRRGRRVVAATLLVLACGAFGFAGGVVGSQVSSSPGLRTDPSIPIATGTPSARPSDSVAGVAAEVLPSTVSIQVVSGSASGSGSGFILRSDGLILTNNHVVASAVESGTITVVFSDGSQERASIVGRTVAYDLAVLSVARSDLPALPLGDSDAVAVGDSVIAIGAPLGLQSTVTTGIVSAMHRPVVAGEEADDNAFISALQTDAAINPGNSGGPLVNLDGEVIGINSAIAQAPGVSPGSAGSIGLGFAIPSNQAAHTAEQLIATGKATYPVIGVRLDSTYSGAGVLVAGDAPGSPGVTPGGPAAKAGIQAGDVIVSFQGRPVTDPSELIVWIRAQRPGDSVKLSVQRGGEARQVTLVLSESEGD